MSGAVVPWLAFGLAAAGAVVGWIVAADKAGRAAVLANGMQALKTQGERVTKLEDARTEDRVIQAEVRAELRAMRAGWKRIERDLVEHLKERSR